MINLIEAINYRSLRYVRQSLSRFHGLVGPNASGKSTFLEVVSFLGDLISSGIDEAINERTGNFVDLVFGRSGLGFELAIEATIPDEIQSKFKSKKFDVIRYEIGLGIGPTGEVQILAEKVVLKSAETAKPRQLDMFPSSPTPPNSIITPKSGQQGTRTIVNKIPGGNDNFYSEVHGESGKGWVPTFKLGPRKSALANLPEDETKFPASTWLKGLLQNSVQKLVLNSLLIRKASPPGQVRGFKPDGSNLPWVVDSLRQEAPDKHSAWISHLQTALGDLVDVTAVEREDDRHKYLVLHYKNGLKIPSWMASDGTLRMLALTLPAYLPKFKGVYLIEEPENGIHPKAVETVLQSLSSVYGAQILMATHSTVILGLLKPSDILCFAKTPEGETDIVTGSDHPVLRDWKDKQDLGLLLASGILG